MQKLLILPLAILFSLLSKAETIVSPQKDFFVCQVSNPNGHAVQDAPVVIVVNGCKFKSAAVFEAGREIASQFDILNDNGEISFVSDFKAKARKTFKIYLSESLPNEHAYTQRVNAQMFLKVGSENVLQEKIASDVDNMYNKLHHHGPAFESELVAYRLYFDQKQTVDIYGKVIKRIELPETMWYPTDRHLEQKYGDDVLYVGGSAGLGTLKGWDGEKAIHFKDVANREMRIIAKGPVRTIVDLNVKGWNGVDMNSRYILYAGHRDAQVVHTFEGDLSKVTFATGVQKIRKGDVMFSDHNGTVADWGRDFPVSDTVRYPQQTVGLGVAIPAEYVVKETVDKLNYLYVLKADNNSQIKYKITFAAQKEEFGYKTSDDFFRYIETWRDEKPLVLKIKGKL